jgi:hypothetical protein
MRSKMAANDIQHTLRDLLEKRMDALYSGEGEKASQEQRHLREGTPERTYWHYGYASALKDVLTLLGIAGGQVN